jgi:hypothetical protein
MTVEAGLLSLLAILYVFLMIGVGPLSSVPEKRS